MGKASFGKFLKEKFSKNLLKEEERLAIEEKLLQVEILEERLKNGEITQSEYEELKSEIKL